MGSSGIEPISEAERDLKINIQQRQTKKNYCNYRKNRSKNLFQHHRDIKWDIKHNGRCNEPE
jgi:hypothetical protein